MHRIRREVVEVIERSPFQSTEKFHLLTTVLGLRSACWLSIRGEPWYPGTTPLDISMEVEWAAHSAVTAVGLEVISFSRRRRWEEFENHRITMNRQYHEFVVAHDFVTACRMKDVLAELDVVLAAPNTDEDNARRLVAHRKLGVMLGYPTHAISAFQTDQMVNFTDVPPEILPPELRPFCCFGFSREHVVEEIAVLRQWVEACAEVSPKIHGEVLAKEVPA